MSFIFISYSRQDQAYVSTLVQALQSHRLPVWIDDSIDYGTTWPRVIQDHLEQCSVFLVVMSPRSEDSHWVQCELSLALELKKPIFPLLLEGRRWLSVAAIQSVDVIGGQLPPARFFDTVRGYFSTPPTVAESLPVQTVVEEKISPVPRPSVKMSAKTTEIELKSDKGVDYRELQRLLKAKKWREADLETWHRMLEAVGRPENDWIRLEELQTFPCADLKTIDALWKLHSGGKFGFSVQKDIWIECGSPTSSGKDWDQFCVKVGWQDETASRYLDYDELKANPDFSPAGEFPVGGWGCRWVGGWVVYLLSHPDL
ncbi:GUN4 domain-containing protein [Halomicronema sp. CCY15110]|uniref:GUN4 domain-containing protein n=1 Tax=Halomicronema sp. CCY15110 TaxID=2767773 RepID=UPI0019529B0D|nr:GUN4 domain-containing protein [Halomicronema sp. CCY15110]